MKPGTGTLLSLLLLAAAAVAFLECDEHLGRCGPEEDHETALVRLLPPEAAAAGGGAGDKVQPTGSKDQLSKAGQQGEATAAGSAGQALPTEIKGKPVSSAKHPTVQGTQPPKTSEKVIKTTQSSQQNSAKDSAPQVTKQAKTVPKEDSRRITQSLIDTNAKTVASKHAKKDSTPAPAELEKRKGETVINGVRAEKASREPEVKHLTNSKPEAKTRVVRETKTVEEQKIPVQSKKIPSNPTVPGDGLKTDNALGQKNVLATKKTAVVAEKDKGSLKASGSTHSNNNRAQESNVNTATLSQKKKLLSKAEIKENLLNERKGKITEGTLSTSSTGDAKKSVHSAESPKPPKDDKSEIIKRFRSAAESSDFVKTEEKNITESSSTSRSEKDKAEVNVITIKDSEASGKLKTQKSNEINTREGVGGQVPIARKPLADGKKVSVMDSLKNKDKYKKVETDFKITSEPVSNDKEYPTAKSNVTNNYSSAKDRKRREVKSPEIYGDLIEVPEISNAEKETVKEQYKSSNTSTNSNKSLRDLGDKKPLLNKPVGLQTNSSVSSTHVIVQGELFKVNDKKSSKLEGLENQSILKRGAVSGSNPSLVNKTDISEHKYGNPFIAVKDDNILRNVGNLGDAASSLNETSPSRSDEVFVPNAMNVSGVYERKKRDAEMSRQSQIIKEDKIKATVVRNITQDNKMRPEIASINGNKETGIKQSKEVFVEKTEEVRKDNSSDLNHSSTEPVIKDSKNYLPETANETKLKVTLVKNESVSNKSQTKSIMGTPRNVNEQDNGSQETVVEKIVSQRSDSNQDHSSPANVDLSANNSEPGTGDSKQIKLADDSTKDVKVEKEEEAIEILPLASPVLKPKGEGISLEEPGVVNGGEVTSTSNKDVTIENERAVKEHPVIADETSHSSISEEISEAGNENPLPPVAERLVMEREEDPTNNEEPNQPLKLSLPLPLESVAADQEPLPAQRLVLEEESKPEEQPRILQRDRDGGRRSVDDEDDLMEAPQLRFPTVPDGETFHAAKLGLSDGIFLFSYLATFISWLQPNDFPVELLRDALWNRLSVMDLINETLQVEVGFIAVLVVGVLLALTVPLTALGHGCCRLLDARNESCDREPTACRRRSLLCGLWTVIMIMAVGVAGMLVSNEQVSAAVSSSPHVLHTALSDTAAYVRSAHQQIAFVTSKSLDQALAAASEDLDDADALLGLPIQRALSRDTGVDVALDALSDVSAAAEDASGRAAAVLEQAGQTRGLALVARERLQDLRYQLDSARRQCAARDRPLCDTVDASGLDVSLRLETLMSDDRLQALRELRDGNLSAAAQQARADFQLLPRQVFESTREARIGIRRELVRERAQLQDTLSPLEWFSRTVSSRVDGARAAAQDAASIVQDVDQWRWLVGLGCALSMLVIWLLLAVGASCGCCGAREKARPVLFTAVVTASLLSLALWAVTLFAFLLGGHGEVLVCRPLFSQPDYPQLSSLLDRPGVLFSAGGGGGFFRNVAGNGSLDVPLRDVLQECELSRPVYPALQLRQLFDVDRATGEGGRWDGVRAQVSRLEVRLGELRVLTPGLQAQLEATLRAAAANLTQHRLGLAGPVTVRDLQALADQLVSVSSQVTDLSSASRLETLAARARRLLASHVTPLEQRKEDLVYRLTALEVALSPLQRQANQSLSHLKTIQYFVVQQGDSIARAAVRRYSDRLLSYLQQARSHVTAQVGRHLSPCTPLYDAFHAARQLLCRHALDPLNGLWFSSFICLVLLVAATPLSLHLAHAFKRRDSSSSLLSSRNSEWQVEKTTKDLY